MLKTNKVEAQTLTINSRVAVPIGDPIYTKSTRGLTKKEQYKVLEIKSVSELDEDTLVCEVVSECGAVGIMQAAKTEKVELVDPSSIEKKTING